MALCELLSIWTHVHTVGEQSVCLYKGGGLVATAADNEIRTKIDPRSDHDHQSKYGKIAGV